MMNKKTQIPDGHTLIERVSYILCLVWLVMPGCAVTSEFNTKNKQIGSIIRRVDNRGTWIDLRAADELAQIGAAAVPDLTRALKHRSKQIRFTAARALGYIGEPAESAVPALIQALEQKNFTLAAGHLRFEFHWVVTTALGRIGGSGVPVLIQLLEDKTGKMRVHPHGVLELGIRAHAASALGVIYEPSKEVVETLINALSDKDTQVRRSATRAFRYKSEKKAIPALIKAVKDRDNEVRFYAASALGDMGQAAQEAVPALAEGLVEEDFTVETHPIIHSFHITSVRTLINIGSSAIPTLAEALHHKDERVRLLAAEGLGKMNAIAAVPVLIEVLNGRWVSDELRLRAAVALGRIDNSQLDRVMPILIKALDDSDMKIRFRAAMGLGLIGEPANAAIPALIHALGDSQATVRKHAAYALGEIGESAKAAVPMLVQALGDSQAVVRAAAAHALGLIGEPAKVAIPTLIEALKDEDKNVRVYTALALKRLGMPEALKEIEKKDWEKN